MLGHPHNMQQQANKCEILFTDWDDSNHTTLVSKQRD